MNFLSNLSEYAL